MNTYSISASKIHFIYFSILLFLFSGKIIAQDSLGFFSISMVPQYMVINGFRIDIEKKSAENCNGFLLGSYLFLNEREKIFPDGNKINTTVGFGFEAIHKRYLSDKKYTQYRWMPYIAYGISYQHFKIKFWEYAWVTFIKDDLEYLEYKLAEQEKKIDRAGVSLLFGNQFIYKNVFLIDVYLGGGIKYSIINSTLEEFTDQDIYIYDYDYTGIVPVIVVRIGILLD